MKGAVTNVTDPRAISMRNFFFSSRRRHTRCSRDWSSDVCSSDLDFAALVLARHIAAVDADEAKSPGRASPRDGLDALNAKVLQSPAAEVLGRDRRAGTQPGDTARARHTGSEQPSGTEGRAQRGGGSERRH